MAKKLNETLKVNDSVELLSYIINVTPELKADLDLPVQGQSIKEIGRIICDNERYRNAFINTINLIGLTIIKRNHWENPWLSFTSQGTLNYGQQIREIINDLCDVYDYNENANNVTRFLTNVVPNMYQYLHELNFQKFYQTSTSDNQLRMAFETEDLFTYVEDSITMLYESWTYDKYCIDKYQLCRRILEGTITSTEIADFDTITTRERVSAMKDVSNKFTFRNRKYNPAGVSRATSFDEQILIINTEFDAKLSTEVLATSFFRDDADFKMRHALIDGFDNHDSDRLTEVLGDAFIPFTEGELAELAKIPAVLIANDFYMDYLYSLDGSGSGTKATQFYNPTTMKDNHFLHVWSVFSTSPFAQANVFTADVTPAVSSVTVSPSTATLSPGLEIKLSASVVTTGFANKAVSWSTNNEAVTISEAGLLKVPSTVTSGTEITVTATSVFDTTKTGTATITVA